MLRSIRANLVLVDHLQPVVVDVLHVDQIDVLAGTVVPLQDLDVVLLDARGLLDDALVGARDFLREEPIPLGIGKGDLVQPLQLGAEVGDQRGFGGQW